MGDYNTRAYKCQMNSAGGCIRCTRQGDMVKEDHENGLCTYAKAGVSWHWLKKQRMAAKVERCHTIPTQGSYSVGQHTFNMQFIALELLGEMIFENTAVQLDLLKAVMTHDLPEVYVGDSPSPVKSEEGVREKFHELEELWYIRNLPTVLMTNGGHGEHVAHALTFIVKFSDCMEFALFSMEQIQMGNEYYWEAMGNVARFLSEMQTKEHPFKEFPLYVDMRTVDLYINKVYKFIRERKHDDDTTGIIPKDCR